MNPPAPQLYRMSETYWRAIIVTLSAAVLLFSIWCLSQGITIIFMHLYYFPIVLVAYRYRWKGFGLATLLASAYLGLVIAYDLGQTEVILGAFYRFFVFVGIAAVIAYLSARLAKAQSTLRESAELNDRYLSLAPAIILVLDRNGTITYLNRKGAEILECTPEEAVGKSWTDRFLPENEQERVKQVISQLMAGQTEPNRLVENPVLTSGGMEKSIRWSNTVLHDENGAITGILAFGEDITEEKWAQDTLREMQQFQESVITNANVWISVLEPDGTLLIWNDAAEAISGYKKTGVLGKRTVWKQLYPDKEYRKKVTGEIQRIIGRDTFLENFETEIRCADGTTKTIVWNTRGLRDSKTAITSYIAIGRDVTAQKSAESRAGESSRFLAAMIDTLPIPVFFKDAEGRYLGCNPPFEQYIGITCDELIGKTAYDIAPKELADRYTAADREILDNPAPQRYETQMQYADGSRHDVIFYKAPFLNKDGSVGGLIGAYLDITERKQSEKALLESESFNRGLVENLPDYIAVYGQDGKLLYVNPSSARALGYDADTLVGTHVLSYIAEEFHDTVKANMATRQKEGNASPYEIDMVTRDGLRRSVIVKATPIQYRNNPAILLLLIDITERKKAEGAMREAKTLIDAVVENVPLMIFLKEARDLRFVLFNRAGEELLGYDREALLGKNNLDLFPPEQAANFMEKDREVLDGEVGMLDIAEEPIQTARKGVRLLHTRKVCIRGADGTTKFLLGISEDITERKQSEVVMRENEEKYRVLFTQMTEGSALHEMVYDGSGNPVDYRILDVNPAFGRILGLKREDVLGKTGREAYGVDAPPFLDIYARVVSTGQPDTSEVYFAPMKKHFAISIYSPGAGRFATIFADITKRKAAEELLRQNQLQLATAMDIARIVNWEYDVATAEFTFDDRFYEFFGTTAEREGGYRMSAETYAREFVYPDDIPAVAEEIQKVLRTKDPLFQGQMEHRIIRRDGEIRTIIVRHAPVMDAQGNVVRTFGANQDITERKLEEEEREKIRWWQEGVNRILESVLSPAPLEEKLKIITDGVVDIFGADFCRIWLIDKGDRCSNGCMHAGAAEGPHACLYRDKCLHLKASSGRYTHLDGKAHRRVPFGAYKIGRIASGQETKFLTNDVNHDPRIHDHAWAKSLGLVAFSGYQLKPHDGEVLGVFALFSRSPISPDMDAILEGLSRAISLSIQKEVTDRALKESETQLNKVSEMARVGGWELDVTTHEVRWTKETYLIHEVDEGSPFELKNAILFYDLPGRVQMEEALQRCMEHGEPFDLELPFTSATGRHLWTRAMGRAVTIDGKIAKLTGTFQDVTGRKEVEEAIRLSNVILTTQQETSPDGILIVDKSGKIISFNHRFTEIWGIPQEVIDSRSDERALSYVLEKLSDPQEFLSRVKYLYEHQQEKSQEEILLKDKKVFDRYSAPMLGEDNLYFGRVWYFHDITGRKQVEEAIRSREEQFRAIFQTQQTGLIMVDAETHTIADINTAALNLTGTTREESIGKICHSFICPSEVGKCPVTDLGYTVDNAERVLVRKNGEKIPILKSVNAVKIGGRPFLIESFIDLSERKRMEAQVTESRQLFADIISFLPDPTFVIDNEGKVLAWNRAIEQLSGVPAADMIGKGNHEYSLWMYGKRRPIIIDLVLHPDQDAARLDYTTIHWEGNTVTAQTDIILPGMGKKTSLSLVASPLMDAQDKVTGAIESIRDISNLREAEAGLARLNANLETIVHNRTRALEEEVTQRMHAERDVQDALSYTRSVIEANPDLIVVLDRNGTVLDINASAEVLTGLTREQLIGTPYFGYLVDDGTLYTAFSRLLENGRLENIIQIRHTDGHVTPLSVNATLIGGKDAPDIRIIVSAHDITRQKHDEEVIRASLEEKVILLREVHHRVKNNLQIIISLVNLQMRQTDDPVVKQIMSETQNRVRAMSLVHEKLYRSESLSRIDFADYTRFLATQLFSFYGTDTRRVNLDFAMGKIMVDINTAVPLGLLMNELVSNALKHAFPNGREGSIRISGGYEGDLITLVVRDNGAGIPADFDWKNTTSLGMRLVTSLIDQVDGTLDLDRTNGTAFTVTVKKDPEPGGAE